MNGRWKKALHFHAMLLLVVFPCLLASWNYILMHRYFSWLVCYWHRKKTLLVGWLVGCITRKKKNGGTWMKEEDIEFWQRKIPKCFALGLVHWPMTNSSHLKSAMSMSPLAVHLDGLSVGAELVYLGELVRTSFLPWLLCVGADFDTSLKSTSMFKCNVKCMYGMYCM